MKNQKGVTLLEVLISVIVLAVGILGLAPLVAVSIYGNSYSDDVGKANALAQRQIELLTNMPSYGNLPYVRTADTVNGMFNVKSVVEDNVSNGTIPSGLFRIRVAIDWTDREMQQRSVSYTTYKPKA